MAKMLTWSGPIMKMEEMPDWCWAAVAESVAHYYDPRTTVTQQFLVDMYNRLVRDPQIAAARKSGNDKKVEDLEAKRNRGSAHGAADPMKLVGHFQEEKTAGTGKRVRNYPGLHDLIKREIDAEQPIVFGGHYEVPPIGHLVLVYGYDYDGGKENINVADPGNGTSIVEKDQVLQMSLGDFCGGYRDLKNPDFFKFDQIVLTRQNGQGLVPGRSWS